MNTILAMHYEFADFSITPPIWRILIPVKFEMGISVQLITPTYQNYTFVES